MGVVDILAEDGMGEAAVYDYVRGNERRRNGAAGGLPLPAAFPAHLLRRADEHHQDLGGGARCVWIERTSS